MAATIQYFTDSSGQIWALSVNTDGSLSSTLVGSGSNPPTTFYNTTAGSIINAANADSQLAAGNASVLLDYVDRIQKRILRESQWLFLKSQSQYFITEPGVTDYWIASGTTPSGAVNTGLALTNIWAMDNDNVWDRTSHRQLMPNSKSVNYASPDLSTPDGKPRYEAPRSFEYSINNPGVFRIFPAPAGQNNYQPVPMAPICTLTQSGSLPARTYYVSATFVDSSGGESTASIQPVILYIPAGYVLNVQPPSPVIASSALLSYAQFNVYAGTSATNMTLQNSAPQSTTWVEPNTGLVTGALAPGTSTIAPLYGYLIEFNYFVQRVPITTQNQVLQVPDYYRDVVIAGVNYLVDLYLNKDPELTKSSIWKAEFLDGLRQIRRDLNVGFRKTDFIAPDNASQLSYTNGLDMYGPSLGEI